MPSATLVAGDLGGFYRGYSRDGGSLGTAFGTLDAQPISGKTIDYFYSSDFGTALALVGNQSPILLSVIYLDGVAWSVSPGTYYSGSNITDYPVTPVGGGFVNGVSYTVSDTGGGPDVTPPTITSSATPSVAENATLSHALTANEAVTWSIIGGADQAKFELSGSTLRWASNGTKDYDAPDDADANNAYLVTVRATDAASNTTDQSITVTVTEGFEGPTWVGKSTALGSTAAGTITFGSSGRAAGDQLYVAIASANQAITAPSGFTEVANSPQFRGTAAAIGGIRLALFEKTSDGTETTVNIADPGDHIYAVGFVVRPKSGEAIAIDASAGKNAAAGTAHSGNALTTTAADCLIVDVWGTDRDSAGPSYSAQANAGLTGLVEQHDAGTTSGVGSGIVIYSGGKIAAGAVAATTATSAASVAWCAITLALKSVGSGGGIVGTASGTLGLTGGGAGAVAVAGAGAGVLAFTGSSGGAVSVTGAGAGGIDFTGSAAGSSLVTGAGAGSLAFLGAGVATLRVGAAGAGDLALGGNAAGAVWIAASAGDKLPLTGQGSGGSGLIAVAGGSLEFSGQATGLVLARASGAGTIGLAGSGSGTVLAQAAAAGAISLSGTAMAGVGISSASSGSMPLTGSASARVAVSVAAAGGMDLVGSGAGETASLISGQAAGTLMLTGSAMGTVADFAQFTPVDPVLIRARRSTARVGLRGPSLLAVRPRPASGVVAARPGIITKISARPSIVRVSTQ